MTAVRTRRRPRAVVAVTAAGVLVAACGVTDRSPARSPEASLSRAALTRLDGAYLLYESLPGAPPGKVRLFRVRGGELDTVESVSWLTKVTAHGDNVVVERQSESSGVYRVFLLRAGRLVSLGIPSGFSPSLSGRGALAWASGEDDAGPGAAPVGEITILARPSLTGPTRTVAVLPAEYKVNGMDWAGDDLVVGVARDGVETALRFAGGRGPAETIGTLREDVDDGGGPTDSKIVSGGSTALLTSGVNFSAYSVSARGAASRMFVQHASALCITGGDDLLLAEYDGTLRLVPPDAEAGRDEPGLPAGRIPGQSITAACP